MNVSIANIKKYVIYNVCMHMWALYIYIFTMQMMIHLPAQLCLFLDVMNIFFCYLFIIFTLCVV